MLATTADMRQRGVPTIKGNEAETATYAFVPDLFGVEPARPVVEARDDLSDDAGLSTAGPPCEQVGLFHESAPPLRQGLKELLSASLLELLGFPAVLDYGGSSSLIHGM
jgi:hypothetical protein